MLRNVAERHWCEEMISALQEDECIDAYQDTQPGGESCLNHNYKQQKSYEKQLSSLHDVKLLFPQASAKDIPMLEYFVHKLESLHRGPGYFGNNELADSAEQAFLFFKYFASHQLSKESIDKFFKIGEYIVKHTVNWDSEKESFYRVKPIHFNMFYAIN